MTDSLEEEIQNRFVVDEGSVIEANLDRVDGLFELYKDGTIVVNEDYRDIEPRLQILIYLIGKRFAQVGGASEEDTLASDFFYEKFNKDDSTIRHYMKDLRDDGLIAKQGQSKHRLVAENLPDTLDQIESAVGEGGGA
jgi:DNA-binding transcriptional ArsR family regulator